jgi:hypothetical protein
MKFVVFSDYINAYSIKRGLKKLGIHLQFMPLWHSDSHIELKSGDVLFFTEEASQKLFYGYDIYNYYPKHLPIPIDDKFAFAAFLKDINELPVPFYRLDEFSSIPFSLFPLCLKSRSSWIGKKRMPGGDLIASHEQLKTIRESNVYIDNQNFFLQRFLKKYPTQCFSTCGFFSAYSPEKTIISVVQRLCDNRFIGSGTIIQTVQDPDKLIDRTIQVLEKMNYTGPFELEFIHNLDDSQYYILELNTRFWMQHGIFIDAYDNALIKLYLNREEAVASEVKVFKPVIWVNSIFLLQSLIMFRMKKIFEYASILFKTDRGVKILFDPSLSIIFIICLRKLISKLRRG